jgi:hypothetical protein
MLRCIAERLLKQAIEGGDFDCSAGKGKPLQKLDSPSLDQAWRLDFHILKNAGLRPLWLELDLEIRRTLQESRKDLANAARTYGIDGPDWENSVLRFLNRIEEVNHLIRELNPKVPHSRFQRVLVDPERETHKVLMCSQMESF